MPKSKPSTPSRTSPIDVTGIMLRDAERRAYYNLLETIAGYRTGLATDEDVQVANSEWCDSWAAVDDYFGSQPPPPKTDQPTT